MPLEEDDFQFETYLDMQPVVRFEGLDAPNQGVDGTCL